MLKHLGSTIALIIGVLAFMAGVGKVQQGDPSNLMVSGPLIILGALAYRSAKKRFLGQVRSTTGRRGAEVFALVLVILLVVMHRDLTYHLATNPTTFILIPVWAFVAYAVLGFRSPKSSATAPKEGVLEPKS